MTTTISDQAINEARNRINRAFGQLRYGALARFEKVNDPDTAVMLETVADNLERFAEILAHYSDKAEVESRDLQELRSQQMAMRAFLGLPAEITQPSKLPTPV